MRIIFLIAVLGVRAFAQTAVYPLHVGDRWEYAYPPLGGSQPTYLLARVLGDTTIPGGHTYAIIRDSSNFSQTYDNMVRQSGDSVLMFDPHLHLDILMFDFSLDIGDTAHTAANGDVILNSMRVADVFGALRNVWSFTTDPDRQAVDDEYNISIVDSIGIIGKSMPMGFSYNLQGAVIDGRVYGTINGIHTDPSSDSHPFHLLQNYPNPFNSTTTIEVQMWERGSFELEIYSVLGQVIKSSVYSEKRNGVFKVALDFTGWPTGSYYCRVSSNAGSQTRRMVYLK